MSAEPIQEKAAVRLDTSTRLAYERTYLAHERTQMAWLRTCLSFISFGFTISKFFEYLHEKAGEQAPLLGPHVVGMLMIVTGLVGLALSTIQHRRAVKMLREQCPGLPVSLSAVSAGFLAVLGILSLINRVLHQ